MVIAISKFIPLHDNVLKNNLPCKVTLQRASLHVLLVRLSQRLFAKLINGREVCASKNASQWLFPFELSVNIFYIDASHSPTLSHSH